jgi:hypothetical protein
MAVAAVAWWLATGVEASVAVFRQPYEGFAIAHERVDGSLVPCALPVAWRSFISLLATWVGCGMLSALPLGYLLSLLPGVGSSANVLRLAIISIGFVATGMAALFILFSYTPSKSPLRLRMVKPGGFDDRSEAQRHAEEEERRARERLRQTRERLQEEARRKQQQHRSRVEAEARRRRQEEEARAQAEAERQRQERERHEHGEAVVRAFEFLGLPPTSSPERVKERFRHRAFELHPDKNRDDLEWATGEMRKLNMHMAVLRRFFQKESASID